MKWIKYEYVCGTSTDGAEILAKKRIGYSESNLAIAQTEAYNGEYTIEEDGTEASNETKVPGDMDMSDYRIKNLGDPVDETDAINVKNASKLIDDKVKSNVYVSLPDYVNITINGSFKIYYRNVFSRDDMILWVGNNNGLTTKYYDNYLSISAVTEGVYYLPWKVYDKSYNLLDVGNLKVIVSAKVPTETTKIIVIGDSTVNAGTMQNKTAELYTAAGASLMLLGTRGGSTHEGRGGWTAKNYCTYASIDGVDNPFFDGDGFDFAYYISNQNQNFIGVHAVVIQLGINDIFVYKDTAYNSESALNYINQMVTSILAYDSAIKVIINLPTTPNSNGTSFTETYGTTQLYWIYNRNIIRFAEELKDYYASNVNVTISASNCVLDTKTQIRDGVHPTEDGYNVLGERLYEVLVSVTDGGVYIAPLLDITQRTFVRHLDMANQVTIGPAATRELDAGKCYDGQFSGNRSTGASNAITYTPISSNSLSLMLSSGASAGNGVEFPVPQLEAGKTYTLKYTADVSNMRVYLLKYNADTTYNSNTTLGSGTGNKSAKITPEAGYIYSIFFSTLIANTLSTYTEISLLED